MKMQTDDWTAKLYRSAFKYLAAQVARTLESQAELFTRQKAAVIGWRSRDRWGYFWLTAYNEIIYRLRTDLSDMRNDLPKRFWTNLPKPAEPYGTELSFHFSELDKIQGSDLVRFVEDTFRHHDSPKLIYRWPLFFESSKWNSDYAWTELGKLEQTKREHVYHTEPRTNCPLCVPLTPETGSAVSRLGGWERAQKFLEQTTPRVGERRRSPPVPIINLDLE